MGRRVVLRNQNGSVRQASFVFVGQTRKGTIIIRTKPAASLKAKRTQKQQIPRTHNPAVIPPPAPPHAPHQPTHAPPHVPPCMILPHSPHTTKKKATKSVRTTPPPASQPPRSMHHLVEEPTQPRLRRARPERELRRDHDGPVRLPPFPGRARTEGAQRGPQQARHVPLPDVTPAVVVRGRSVELEAQGAVRVLLVFIPEKKQAISFFCVCWWGARWGRACGRTSGERRVSGGRRGQAALVWKKGESGGEGRGAGLRGSAHGLFNRELSTHPSRSCGVHGWRCLRVFTKPPQRSKPVYYCCTSI